MNGKIVNVDGKRWRVKVIYHAYLSVPTLKGVRYIDSGSIADITHHLTDQEVKDVFVMVKSQGCMNSDPGLDKSISNAECYICRASRSGLTSPTVMLKSLGGHFYECYREVKSE